MYQTVQVLIYSPCVDQTDSSYIEHYINFTIYIYYRLSKDMHILITYLCINQTLDYIKNNNPLPD